MVDDKPIKLYKICDSLAFLTDEMVQQCCLRTIKFHSKDDPKSVLFIYFIQSYKYTESELIVVIFR